MSDPKQARRAAAAAALGGLMSGVGQSVSDRVRQELDAVGPAGEGQPAKRAAAAALGGLVGGVGQNVADLVRQELGAARTEVLESAKAAGRGAGLLGGAAAAGHTSMLFVGVAVWRGLGNRIGFARSALVVAALSGAAAAVLASNGAAELGRAQGASREARQQRAGAAGTVAPETAAASTSPAPAPAPEAPAASPSTELVSSTEVVAPDGGSSGGVWTAGPRVTSSATDRPDAAGAAARP